ncbi:MAG TPA: hypothetical protein VEP90_12640 [Methylomirabilota bacterium]|nr:hypothetical protein [Methylomirabilota bacterium]
MKTFKRVGLDVKVVSRTILGSCLMATNAHMTRSETYPEASGPKCQICVDKPIRGLVQ